METNGHRLFRFMKPDDYDSRTDEELIANFQASGDQRIFAALWRRHWTRIYRQCLAFAANLARISHRLCEGWSECR